MQGALVVTALISAVVIGVADYFGWPLERVLRQPCGCSANLGGKRLHPVARWQVWLAVDQNLVLFVLLILLLFGNVRCRSRMPPGCSATGPP